MKRHHLAALALLGALVLPGCPSDENPPVLWLALDGSEVKLKLQDQEPKPY
jgi:hypothetical protein